MQQEAYDFGMFENRPAPAKKTVPLRSVKGGKKPSSQLHQTVVNVWNVMGCAMFLALAILLIQSKVTLTELNTQVQRTQNQLTTSQSTYNYLNSELTSRTNMANIEDAARRLGLMKPSAYLINTARGGLIDEAALCSALKRKAIAGAAIDTFDPEPLSPDSPLRSSSATLTPHLAASSMEAAANVSRIVAANIVDVLLRGKTQCAVNSAKVKPHACASSHIALD